MRRILVDHARRRQAAKRGGPAVQVGISPATVKRGWAMARAWLRRELGKR
jgi:hypothetical protein